jgi:two-component system CheB/CheR fusion protein
MSQLFELLLSSHGVDFRRYKTSTVLRRLVRRMVMHRLRSLDTYVQLLRADPSELGALAAQLRIGVTAFYRDPQAMSFLGEAVLPPLLDQLPQGETFRAWVAGCSTGEEAYTLALLIEEHGRRRRRRLPYKIFATDIDAASLAIASAGAYAPSVVADLPPELVAQWFSPLDDLLVISPDVRENVVFARHDLLTDPPFTNLHMISCRNVLIYLEPDAQQAVIEQFRYGLHEEGLLFLGPSETPGRASDGFAPLHGTGRLYRSRGRSSARSQPTRRVPRTPSTRANVRAALDQGRIAEALLKGWAGRRAALLLAVNAAQEVLYSVGRHTDLLSVPEGAPDYRLTTMLPRPIGIPALSCAQRVMRTGEAVEYAGIELSHEGQSRSYDLSVVPIGSPTGEHLVGVALHERVASVAPPAEPLPSDLHQELQLQLQHTRESLQSTVEELEAANEELQATNEELLASNEELQATNEELQSVNEELHTVNGEHQLKILELTEKTNDLDNLVRNTRQATLFVDENLDVRLFTEELTAILQIRPVDVGRPASDLVHRLVDEPHPAQTAAEVLHSGRDVEREVRTAQGRTFLMRVLPYRVSARANAGAVLTFVDITRTQRTDRGSEPPVA